jgi:hypothetical protein
MAKPLLRIRATPGPKNAECIIPPILKRWNKSGYATVFNWLLRIQAYGLD